MARILKIDSKKDSDFLRAKASSLELEKITVKEINELAKEMRQIMKKAFGVGLSANQIGKNMRLFVAQMPEQNGQKSGRFYTVINPEIVKISKESEISEEGCLSVPEKSGLVKRAKKITISGFDKNKRPITIKAWGLLARIFQHEIDHLNG